LKCVAQINDVYFKSCLTEKIEDKRLILLNSYDLVSKTIINLNKGLFSDNTTNVIIAGFGNLGKMFLFNLPQILDAEKFNIIIIDKCKELKSQFEIFSSLNELNISCNLINNDIKDKVFWEKIFKDKQSEENIVIFLCTDDDTSNISTSLFLSKLVKENNVNVNIISRYFKEPKFLNDLISRQDYENKKIMSFTLSKIFEEKLEELIN